MHLKFDDNINTIKESLVEVLSKIKEEGETPESKAEMLYKFARYKFSEEEFDESHETFSQLNIHLTENNLPRNYEIFYWIGRILEKRGEYINAKTTYLTILNKIKQQPNKDLENEILDRINLINEEVEQ